MPSASLFTWLTSHSFLQSLTWLNPSANRCVSFDVGHLPALPSRSEADTSHNALFSRGVLDFRQLHCE